MKVITVVTGNQGKFLEIKDILSRHGIRAVQEDAETVENGSMLEERCLSKARSAFSAVKKPLIIDDTGLFFEAFDNPQRSETPLGHQRMEFSAGFPGPFPKKVFAELGFKGIMERLSGKKRGAYFRCLVCYIDNNGNRTFEGIVRGKISENIYEGGHDSLPYDRIFVPSGHDVPFCMISEKEKNLISHRAKAVENFAEWFSTKHLLTS